MLQDFRAEKWYSIFTAILTKTVQSATLSASVNDFVSSSIEALSPNMKISVAERQHILENLWKVFNVGSHTDLINLLLICYYFFVEFCSYISKSNST